MKSMIGGLVGILAGISLVSGFFIGGLGIVLGSGLAAIAFAILSN